MTRHTYLFFIEKGNISVFSYKKKKTDELKYGIKVVPNCGEDTFELTEDFWKWWKAVVSYTESDETDICFLYDEKNSLIEHILSDKIADNNADSVWDTSSIYKFFLWKKCCSKVTIEGNNDTKCYFDDFNSAGGEKLFYTNVILSEITYENNNGAKINEDIQANNGTKKNIAGKKIKKEEITFVS